MKRRGRRRPIAASSFIAFVELFVATLWFVVLAGIEKNGGGCCLVIDVDEADDRPDDSCDCCRGWSVKWLAVAETDRRLSRVCEELADCGP
jgi:hypothetical protein